MKHPWTIDRGPSTHLHLHLNLQVLPRVAAFGVGDIFWGAGGNDAATAVAAFWAQVDYMVAYFYHI
jgi:hypothetical protein